MTISGIITYVKRLLLPEKRRKMAKKYDVIVYDSDPNVKPDKQYGLVAENAEALMKMFEMCGQSIEIVKVYEDDESHNFNSAKQHTAKNTTQNQQETNAEITQTPTAIDIAPSAPSTVQIPPRQYVPVVKTQPKYFDIGGIKCKIENGKMYQKQWMRLSDKESMEFRLVSDTNNKICPIKGKHIEIMKWVLVEDESEDTTDNASGKKLELLND